MMRWGDPMETNEKAFKTSRLMYILQAAFEFLISNMVTGSFLAIITNELGFTDGMTGILSTIGSLGCVIQLFSMSIRTKRVKPLVITLSLLTQVLFLTMYLIPLSRGSQPVRQAAFFAVVLLAYVFFYLIHPKKISWLMSIVDQNKRGRFTAVKENASLLSGMFFCYILSAVIDYFSARGELRIAFIICVCVMPVLILLHTLSLLFAIEVPQPVSSHSSKGSLRHLLKDKNVIRVTVVFVLYFIANGVGCPFLATYQLNELGFSMTLVTILVSVTSFVRVLFAQFWGRYADKKSFAVMMEKSLHVLAAAYLCAGLTTPSNALIMFTLYSALTGVAMGGISSSIVNLIFDYVPPETGSDAFAVCQAISGVAGFFTTMLVSPLVTAIQQNGNRVLGIPIYAQQLLCLLQTVLLLITFLYVRTALVSRSKKRS